MSKIYNSAEYIEEPKIGDLRLGVNSMWDFGSRDVCFRDTEKTFGGGYTTISYNLKECIEVSEDNVVGGPRKCMNARWKDAEVTPEIAMRLEELGYTVNKQLKFNQQGEDK